MNRLLPFGLIAIIVFSASWIRLADLGRGEFSSDELCMEIPAQSLRLGQGPRLPSGALYERGLDITRLIAFTQQFVADPETHARLPSALFGILSLCLFGALAWSLGGPWAAVWAVGLLAIYPEAIRQSRLARFYTYQLCFGLLAAFAFWRVIRRDADGARRATWLWAVAAMLLTLLAARVQIVSLSTAAGWGVGVAGCVAFNLATRSWASARSSAAFQIVVLAVCAIATLAISRPELVSEMANLALTVPAWAGGRGDPRSYYWELSADFPLLISLLPLIYLVVLRHDPRLGIFLAAWFCVPFLVHSFVFAWKGDRFLLVAVPGLLLSGGVAASLGCGALYRAILRVLEESPVTIPRFASGALVGAVALFAVATTPAFNLARKTQVPTKNLDWSSADRIRRESPDAALPVGSSMPLPAQFYWERLDFVVGTEFLESLSDTGVAVVRAQGTLDDYTGVPILTTPEEIRRRFASARGVWIGIDPQQRVFGNLEPALVEQLKYATEFCRGRCADLELYLWEFAP